MGIFTKKKAAEKRSAISSVSIPWGLMGGSSWLKALKSNPTVFACEKLISDSIASLPVDLMFKQNDGSRVKAYNHQYFYTFKHEPNPEEVPQVFYSRMVRHILRGNAFILKTKGPAFYLLEPDQVVVKRDKAGRKIFTFSGKEYTAEQILHIPGAGYDGNIGYSPLEIAKDSLEAAVNIEKYAARAFENRISSRMVVDIKEMYPEGATGEDIKEIAQYLRNNYSGEENEGKPLITWDGMKITPVEATDNRESQLLENRQFQNKLICQIYNVPQFLLGEGDNKYGSHEAQNINFLQFTLLPWIKTIEQYMGKLLTAYERERYFFTFNVSGFLRGDHKSRMEAYVKGIQSGIYSVNEVRNLENMVGLKEAGDEHFIPANLMPLKDDVVEAYMASAKLKAKQLMDQESQNMGDDKQ